MGDPHHVPAAKGCLLRGSSTKSNKKLHVKYNDSTELIPCADLDQSSPVDDDEVFSDSIPPQLPRGDMCAPYRTKRGSVPGLVALPDWFALDSPFGENDGVQEPPVTPVGRDELELKRRRLFSEILSAVQASVEHRVRFNPSGPNSQHQETNMPGNGRFNKQESGLLRRAAVLFAALADQL